jgi:hypothetical protein
VSEQSDFNRALTDVAYTAIGFGLLGFQRAQVRRRELTRQFEQLVRQAAGLTGAYGPAGSGANESQ